MAKRGFEGWYFKHQQGDDVVVFIPGRAESGAFVQTLTCSGSRCFELPRLTVRDGTIRAGDCLFSPRGCRVDLPGVSGELSYGKLTPLRSHIMGPFRALPMQCSHGVISMGHSVSGAVWVDGVRHGFEQGRGYAETDSGRSFPRSYLWLQCNDFPQPCSVMAAVAHIPFGGLSFTGCICAIVYRGREYRLATYLGARVRECTARRLCLQQGQLRLQLDIRPGSPGSLLLSPRQGRMRGRIRESCDAAVDLRLWRQNATLIELSSSRAAYEFVPEGSADLAAARL